MVESRNNSLATYASIRMVGMEELEDNNIRAVTMAFEGLMRDLVGVPGWHLSLDRRVPFLVVPNSKNFKDSYLQFNRNDFPYRTTIILKDHIWEMVAFAEEKQNEDEIPECEGVETTVVAFFHQDASDVNAIGTIHTGADDPFLQPLLQRRPQAEEHRREQQGFGWFGKTLEDGVL